MSDRASEVLCRHAERMLNVPESEDPEVREWQHEMQAMAMQAFVDSFPEGDWRRRIEVRRGLLGFPMLVLPERPWVNETPARKRGRLARFLLGPR